MRVISQIQPQPIPVELQSTGALSPAGQNFFDKMKIGTTADISLIGRLNYGLQYSQVAGQGFTDGGVEHFIDPLILPFFIQVDPCPISAFTVDTADEEMIYIVEEGVRMSGVYTYT